MRGSEPLRGGLRGRRDHGPGSRLLPLLPDGCCRCCFSHRSLYCPACCTPDLGRHGHRHADPAHRRVLRVLDSGQEVHKALEAVLPDMVATSTSSMDQHREPLKRDGSCQKTVNRGKTHADSWVWSVEGRAPRDTLCLSPGALEAVGKVSNCL